MIPTIGLIVAIYVIARLLQVPIEYHGKGGIEAVLWVISILAILVIGSMAMGLAMGGVTP